MIMNNQTFIYLSPVSKVPSEACLYLRCPSTVVRYVVKITRSTVYFVQFVGTLLYTHGHNYRFTLNGQLIIVCVCLLYHFILCWSSRPKDSRLIHPQAILHL